MQRSQWLNHHKQIIIVIFAFACLRMLISFKLGLGVDEAHYAMYGLRLDWSYFDHPPLVGWVNFLFLSVFGIHDFVVRLPANLCGIVSSLLVFQISWKISGNRKAALASVLALNVAFMPAGLFIMFVPDTLLLPLALWLVLITSELVLEPKKGTAWLKIGLCLGLCGLTKYTSAIFLVSLVGIALSERVWRQWLTWRLVTAAALSGTFILPVLYWNQQHDWISFAYQTGHVVGQKRIDLKSFFASLLTQIVAYSPFLVLTSFLGLAMNRIKNKKKSQEFKLLSRVSLWFVVPCFLFFAFSGFTNFVLPHWVLVVYVLFLVVSISENFEHSDFKFFLKWSLSITAVLTLLIYIELLFQVIPFPDYKSLYTDLTGWPELRQDLVDFKRQFPSPIAVGIANWTLGSRAVYYFSSVSEVFVLDQRKDQFDLWEAGHTPTTDMLLLSWHGYSFEVPLDKMCQSHKKIKEHTFENRNYFISYAITGADWILCRGFNWKAATSGAGN